MNEYYLTIAIDLGDENSYFAVIVSDSEDVVEDGTLKTTKEGFTRKFSNMPRSRTVLEAGTRQAALTPSSHQGILTAPAAALLSCHPLHVSTTGTIVSSWRG